MRPIIATVGPLAAAAAAGLAASQTVPAAATLALNGSAATEYTANSIALSQTLGAAGPVTLNGAKVVGGVAILDPYDDRVVIVSAGNDTAVNFTVSGIGQDGITSVVEVIKGSNASVTSTTNTFYKVLSVAASAATSAITVGHQGSIALDKPRRILITTGGVDTGITYTVYGTDRAGNPISEAVTGPSTSTAYTNQDFATVSRVTTSGASASTVTIGTNGVASSAWVRFDEWAMPQIGIQLTASGTVNYTLQQTLDDPNDPTNPVASASVTWINSADANAVGATGSIQTNYAYAPRYARILLNSGTGSVTGTFSQINSVAF